MGMKKRKTLAIDFDGVIHKYSKGWQDGSVYDDLDFTGIVKAHAAGYAVAIFTSRPIDQVEEVLFEDFDVVVDSDNEITFWDGGEDGKTVLVTNRKIAAVAYVDDRAICHYYGDDWDRTFATIAGVTGEVLASNRRSTCEAQVTQTSQTSLSVKHNMEMAHRLFLTPGKCERIHGHSWWVTLTCWGNVDSNGLLEGIAFGDLKYLLRNYMDSNLDHHLLLNMNDPFAGSLSYDGEIQMYLPGLMAFADDPTTENIAAYIGQAMAAELNVASIYRLQVEVWETAVNCATWRRDG